MPGAAVAHGVKAWLMLSVVVAAADDQLAFGPNDLRAHGKAANLKAGLNHPRMDAAVPDVGNIAGVQCPGLAPISAVVVGNFPRRSTGMALPIAKFGGIDAVFLEPMRMRGLSTDQKYGIVQACYSLNGHLAIAGLGIRSFGRGAGIFRG
jgi:hypothetical protein